jgi:hypothetical protein
MRSRSRSRLVFSSMFCPSKQSTSRVSGAVYEMLHPYRQNALVIFRIHAQEETVIFAGNNCCRPSQDKSEGSRVGTAHQMNPPRLVADYGKLSESITSAQSAHGYRIDHDINAAAHDDIPSAAKLALLKHCFEGSARGHPSTKQYHARIVSRRATSSRRTTLASSRRTDDDKCDMVLSCMISERITSRSSEDRSNGLHMRASMSINRVNNDCIGYAQFPQRAQRCIVIACIRSCAWRRASGNGTLNGPC